MGKYILRRILQMIPVVLGTTLLIYALVFALPGDPVADMDGHPLLRVLCAGVLESWHSR